MLTKNIILIISTFILVAFLGIISCADKKSTSPQNNPSVSLTYPNGGETLGGSATINWTATDADPGETALLSIDLDYSSNGGSSWTAISYGESNDSSYLWDVSGLSEGSNYLVRITATDPASHSDTDESDAAFAIIKGVQEYESDANTVMLDHLNGTTLGSASNVSFGASCPALNDCAILDGPEYGSTTYIQYAAIDPLCISDGTLEAWIYLDGEFDQTIVISQGPYMGSPAGWVFHLSVEKAGTSDLHVQAHVWNAFILLSNGSIPLRTWTHIAFTWGNRGAELWINGQLDATDTSTACPASGYGGHLILRSSSPVIKIDEVRISNIQRQEFSSLTSSH